MKTERLMVWIANIGKVFNIGDCQFNRKSSTSFHWKQLKMRGKNFQTQEDNICLAIYLDPLSEVNSIFYNDYKFN